MLLVYLFSRITLHLAQHGAHPPQEYFAKTQHPLRSRPHHLRHCRRPRKPRRGGDKIKCSPPTTRPRVCPLKKTRGKVSYMKEIRNFASHCRRFPDANRLFVDNAIDRQHSINNLKKQKDNGLRYQRRLHRMRYLHRRMSLRRNLRRRKVFNRPQRVRRLRHMCRCMPLWRNCSGRIIIWVKSNKSIGVFYFA